MLDQRGQLLRAALGFAGLALFLAGCIHYAPPASRGTFDTELGPGDAGTAFRFLVSVVNRRGYPIQSSDSGAGLLRVGPMSFQGGADCGRVTSDIDAIQLSAPMGTITFVLAQRGDVLFLSATSQVVQTVYQWNARAFSWRPTHVINCHSMHYVENGVGGEVHNELVRAREPKGR